MCRPPAGRTRTLFVTGLGGQLGRELAAVATAAGWRVAGTVRARPAPDEAVSVHLADVRRPREVAAALEAERPDAVVHTAYVQDGPDAASVNGAGAGVVAAACAARELRLVHLSTDVVFSGRLGRPLREDDPVDPVTAYGATKADGERRVFAAHPGATLVRTSLLWGASDGSLGNHERFALDAAAGRNHDGGTRRAGHVSGSPPSPRFFTDELRCPIRLPVLAERLLALVDLDCPGPLHVAGDEAMDRLTFARRIVEEHGRDPAALVGGPGGPDRPKDTRLDCSRAAHLLQSGAA